MAKNQTAEQLPPDYVIDVLNAMAVLKRFPDADPERIGMWGHSMGGWITLRVMVTDPDIKAGVIWAGVVASYEDLLTPLASRQRTDAHPAAGQHARTLAHGPGQCLWPA